MTELKEFKLPDAGEGLTEADIVAWHVKPGDQVEDGQIIVEVETAKAVVELPSPWDGTVARLLAEEGQTVEVGVPIIAIEVAGADGGQPIVAASGQEKADYAERSEVPARLRPIARDRPARTACGPGRLRRQGLVDHAPRAQDAHRGGRRGRAARDGRGTHRAGDTGGTARDTEEPPVAPAVRALAKPPVRKLAKDLGISLAELAGSGPDGSITRDDVQRAATADSPVRSGHPVSGKRGPDDRVGRGPRPPARAARSAFRSAACASTWPRPWCRARSPRRTSPSSCRST